MTVRTSRWLLAFANASFLVSFDAWQEHFTCWILSHIIMYWKRNVRQKCSLCVLQRQPQRTWQLQTHHSAQWINALYEYSSYGLATLHQLYKTSIPHEMPRHKRQNIKGPPSKKHVSFRRTTLGPLRLQTCNAITKILSLVIEVDCT